MDKQEIKESDVLGTDSTALMVSTGLYRYALIMVGSHFFPETMGGGYRPPGVPACLECVQGVCGNNSTAGQEGGMSYLMIPKCEAKCEVKCINLVKGCMENMSCISFEPIVVVCTYVRLQIEVYRYMQCVFGKQLQVAVRYYSPTHISNKN